MPPPQALSSESDILIYLPPGVFVSGDGTSNGTETPAVLTSLLPNSTIITLNYRLCPPNHIFPLPIHDTATAFNYILRTFANHTTPRISLLGSHIGGTLATTLALTSPNSIHSIAVSEPIVDWVSLDAGNDDDETSPEIPTPTKRKAKSNQYASADAKSLLTLRSKIFSKPDNFFDPFASPTLFLRAPGRDCPQPYLDPEELTGGEAFGPYDDDTYSRSRSLSISSAEEEDPASLRPVRRRKVLRRWPSDGPPENAQLPHFRVFVGDDQEGEGMVLRQQGEELVELMRKVCFYGREREVREGRIGCEILGRKNEEEGGMRGIAEGARWLARKLEEA